MPSRSIPSGSEGPLAPPREEGGRYTKNEILTCTCASGACAAQVSAASLRSAAGCCAIRRPQNDAKWSMDPSPTRLTLRRPQQPTACGRREARSL